MAKQVKKDRTKKVVAAAPRKRKLTKKQAWQKVQKDIVKQPPIPGSFSLLRQVFGELRRFWKPLGGIFVVYLILNAVFASGFISGLNDTVRNVRGNLAGGHSFSTAVNGFGSLLGSGAGNGQGSSASQSLLLIIESLAIIWALRHLLANEKIGIKQAYYQSMAPLVPFILVVFVIILQLLPVTLGSLILAVLLTASVSSALFTVIMSVLLALLAAWSLYMLSSSIFALYIVTLPDMQPRQALRSAKNLVRFRRWPIMRRLLFLPICILLMLAVIMVPVILLIPFLTTAVFFTLVMLAILFAHAYLYSLYRGLIA